MKYCEKCRVSVPGDLHTCPLCQGDLSGLGEAGRTAFPVLPASQSLHKGLLRLIGLGTIAAAAVWHCGQLKFAAKRLVVCFRGCRRHQLLAHFLDGRKKRGNIPKALLWQVGLISALALLWDWWTGGRLSWSVDFVIPLLLTANDRHGSHRPGDAAENPGLYPISDAGRRIRLYPVCPFAVWLPSSCLPLGGMRRGKHYFTGCAVPV